jgi:hypothetical protein
MEYILDTSDGIYNTSMTGELIRCRDCRHFLTGTYHNDDKIRHVCASLLFPVEPDDYCSYAEKREEKKEES